MKARGGLRMNRTALLPNRLTAGLSVIVAAIAITVLLVMGRPPICGCGTVELWHGVVESAGNSQHLSDWYSFSHAIHGMLFFGAAWVLWRCGEAGARLSSRLALPFAVAAEGAWEILENSPVIIDRYRAVTVSWGYSGDSVLNSASDIGFMAAGFLIAGRLPWWGTVLLALAFELFTLAMIRDNLMLNVLMLAWPVDAVRAWQAAG